MQAQLELRRRVAAVARLELGLAEAQQAHGTERRLSASVVEQIGAGVIVADADGVIRVFNPEAARQHGVPHRNVGALDWGRTYGLFTLEGQPLPLEQTPLYRAVKGERVQNARWKVRRPDGTEIILEGTAVPLHGSDGALAGGVLTTHDVTERARRPPSCTRARNASGSSPRRASCSPSRSIRGRRWSGWPRLACRGSPTGVRWRCSKATGS